MKRSLHFLTILIAMVLALINSFPVLAQEEGTNPQIALSVFQASPGATIEIAGARFEPDIMVNFLLFINGNQIQLGTTLADDHGEFLAATLLPYELQPGQYEFHAIDEKNRVAIFPLMIVPDPNGADEQRTDEDPLLAPMPTYAPGVSVTPMHVSESMETPATLETSTFPWMPVVAGVVVLFVLFLVIFFRRKRT